jgi:hypothetical protein
MGVLFIVGQPKQGSAVQTALPAVLEARASQRRATRRIVADRLDLVASVYDACLSKTCG